MIRYRSIVFKRQFVYISPYTLFPMYIYIYVYINVMIYKYVYNIYIIIYNTDKRVCNCTSSFHARKH